jgi:DNA-binding response OmpR family regulator
MSGVIASVVVCDDDQITLELLCEHLSADHFDVRPASCASEALRLCRENDQDLLLLDMSLSDASGVEVLRTIRDDQEIDPSLAVIVLADRSGNSGCVQALDCGADDYLVKPFRFTELRARIRAVLRRRSRPAEAPQRIGDLVIDPAHRRVTVAGRRVALCRREFSLLRALASDPGRVFTKEELLGAVWGHRGPSKSRTLDSHASRLRRKLDPDSGRFVINCWGVGYRLIDRQGA